MKTNFWPILAGLATVIIATGCVALNPQPEDTRFFTLSSEATDAIQSAASSVQVEIRLNRISDYLQTSHMVFRVSPTELKYSDKHRWAEPLEDAFIRVVANTLRENLPEHVSVRTVPIRTAGPNIVTVDINLVACEAESPATAVLEADWQIWEGDAGTPSSTGHFRQSLEGTDGASFEQLAPLLGRLTVRFANSLNEVVQPAIDLVEDAGTGN